MTSALDELLGPGVVYYDGGLRLDDAALSAQLHRKRPPAGERCHCKACVADRDAAIDALHAPEPPAEIAQPWQPRAPRDRAELDVAA